jgi:AcrR family transcriptional regulator
MGRRNDHSREQIRALVLEAAESIIRAQGLSGLTVRKIANEIGYSAGTLYLVFENLDDIVMQVNACTLDELQSRLQTTIDQEEQRQGTAREIVYVMVNQYVYFVLQHSNRWRAMFDSRITDLPELPRWYQDKVDALFRLAEVQLQRLNPEAPEEVVVEASRALWCAVYGVCMFGGSLKDVASRDYTIETLVKNLLDRYLAAFEQGKEEFAGEAA